MRKGDGYFICQEIKNVLTNSKTLAFFLKKNPLATRALSSTTKKRQQQRVIGVRGCSVAGVTQPLPRFALLSALSRAN